MLFFNSHAPGVDFLTPLIAGEDLKFIYPCRYIAWCEENKVWCKSPGFSVLDSNNYRFDENGNRLADDTMWKVGSRCIARWEDDGVWYRAEVKKVQWDGVLVLFIDYGNSAIVSEVVSLFSEIPESDKCDEKVISSGGGNAPSLRGE